MLILDRQREIDDLKALKEKTNAFIGDVFDWVSCLKSLNLLQHLHDFNYQIDAKIKELEDVRNTDEV